MEPQYSLEKFKPIHCEIMVASIFKLVLFQRKTTFVPLHAVHVLNKYCSVFGTCENKFPLFQCENMQTYNSLYQYFYSSYLQTIFLQLSRLISLRGAENVK